MNNIYKKLTLILNFLLIVSQCNNIRALNLNDTIKSLNSNSEYDSINESEYSLLCFLFELYKINSSLLKITHETDGNSIHMKIEIPKAYIEDNYDNKIDDELDIKFKKIRIKNIKDKDKHKIKRKRKSEKRKKQKEIINYLKDY